MRAETCFTEDSVAFVQRGMYAQTVSFLFPDGSSPGVANARVTVEMSLLVYQPTAWIVERSCHYRITALNDAMPDYVIVRSAKTRLIRCQSREKRQSIIASASHSDACIIFE